MHKILASTALSLLLIVGLPLGARAEIVDYGYGYGYGTGYGQSGYPYGSAYPSVTLTRDLTLGSYGADVQALEMFLVMRGFLAAPGNGIFSLATRDAVVRFQAASGISPASGYVGPLTRAYVNAFGSYGYGQYPYYGQQYGYGQSSLSCPRGTYPQYTGALIGCLSGSSGSGSSDLSGSASLRNFRLNAEDTTLYPGDDGNEVLEARFDVRGGDVRVERVDFVFEFAGNGSEADDRPWQVFDRARLVADGDTIADVSVSRSGDWNRDGSEYTLRLDDLDDYVVREGDRAELVLELDVRSSVQGSNVSNAALWDVWVPDSGIRVIDGEDDSHTIGNDDDTVRVYIRR